MIFSDLLTHLPLCDAMANFMARPGYKHTLCILVQHIAALVVRVKHGISETSLHNHMNTLNTSPSLPPPNNGHLSYLLIIFPLGGSSCFPEPHLIPCCQTIPRECVNFTHRYAAESEHLRMSIPKHSASQLANPQNTDAQKHRRKKMTDF